MLYYLVRFGQGVCKIKMRVDTFANRLNEAIRIRGIKKIDLAKKTGIDKASISQWVKGVYEARQEGVYKLSKALEVNEAWLMGYDIPMERLLDETQVPDPVQRLITKLPLYELPISAGSGEWIMEGTQYEIYSFENVPKGADLSFKICGTSMEPMYSDGDVVFVKSRIMVENGQVGVFYLNGEGYMKMLQGNKLISFNPEYKPIIIGEFDEFFPFGRVVDKLRHKL